MAPLLRCCVFSLLLFFLTLDPGAAEGNGPRLQRQKREWVVAPRKLKENHDYTGLLSIAKIRSDREYNRTIYYSLSGRGVDQPPIGRFSVDSKNGFIKVHSLLDREDIAIYHLKGVAKFKDGTYAENDINVTITVEDVNDCIPVITVAQVGSVNESSAEGTVVMRVNATDCDEPNTAHTKLFYSIDEESNRDGMFYINSETGDVMVKQTNLDREIKDTYNLVVTASDMNGQSGGNTGGGEIQIKIQDINDNVPTLEKEMYEGSVMENTIGTEVMRIQSVDMDMIHTDNWNAVYEIVSGNEGGYFSIVTDAKTNEGIIMVNKPLDYEELKALNLGVAVSNKAGYNFGSSQTSGSVTSKSYPVKINVVNQNEGPRFQPGVKVVTISEDQKTISLNKIFTNYAAIDSDTLETATNVRYAKVRDDDNWLTIDEKTADIRLNKLPDRESTFLVNGTYYAEIICMTDDNPSKTATGTIAIQVEDFNDHCPKLTTTAHTMCLGGNAIYATAVDEDAFPNSAPFEFTVIGDQGNQKWTVEHLNDTTSILRDNANLWPGIFQVAVEVKDQQGKACDEVQMIDVSVCECEEDTQVCAPRRAKTVGLGAGGILLLLLGLLLLLLLPLLLLFCLCGGGPVSGDFKQILFDTKPQLMSFHTEGRGEDKDVPLLHVPIEVDGGAANLKSNNNYESKGYLGSLANIGGGVGGGAGYGGGIDTSNLTAEEFAMYSRYERDFAQEEADYRLGAGMGAEFSGYGGGAFDGMALSEHFLQEYYTNKSNHATQESQQKDGLLVYDYEGQESLAGSVGCCSLLENDDDLSFLNDLGYKFKTLAEICQGSTIVTQSANAEVSSSRPRPVSPVRPSTSSHTHFHTHTESVRDSDRVHINTVDTSNAATGSSTIFQEERITERAQVPTVQVQDNITIPSQTMLIQQPTMYYTAAPMYVVESQPQMMLVAGGAQQQGLVQVGGLQGSQGMVLVDRQVGVNGGMGQVQVGGLQGSQGMVLIDRQVGVNGGMGQVQVGGLQGSQGMVLVDRQVGVNGGMGQVQVGGLQGSQGMVFVDRQVGVDGGMGQVAQGFSQGTISRKVLLVENGSTAGQQGGQFAQGFIQMGQGSTEQGLEVSGQGFEVRGQGYEVRAPSFTMGSLGSTGLNEDFSGHTQVSMATPKLQGSKKQVVQHKKVTVTERNIESNTRA
ncbi:desmoglein-2-like isoform X2 [Hippoglossus hippoglossus]|uniref:desmoglein-2-like isoform X1 n=1 Tax=Hippoglossus hippoglossus TaxID=8267 RepID=UPI00148C3FC1|nr:desmoglein-2-like isoform X1 [Hippoglossus hippoglossus]XP_034469315.1 desmoglein-2-like isoform X2 [Hippoglossus hippoglossus]